MEPTLLDYLARFSSFTRQSELLCTQGLAYILQTYDGARVAISKEIEETTGFDCDHNLEWLAEPVQSDGSRPDLEARAADKPVVKLEAKLRAELSSGQLESYVHDLFAGNGGLSVLLVLVPEWRIDEINRIVSETFGQSVAPPFCISREVEANSPRVIASVISWNGLFDSLESGDPYSRYNFELEQLRSMYLALSGDHLTALASEDIQKQWKAHESEYHHLVDQLTRRLSEGERTLPFRDEIIAETTGTDKPSSYRLRYVCPFFNLKGTCFSIGVREPFVNYSSPIWMRFHWQTPNFEIVQSRIKLSDVDWIESNGHLWLPLEERLGEQFNKQLDYLYDKVVSISDIVDLPQS